MSTITNIVHYRGVANLCLDIWPSGKIERTYYHVSRSRDYSGKMLFFDVDNGVHKRTAKFLIENSCVSGINPKEYKKLYVSRKSKIPRDTLRNSGYSIVLDKNNADVVVIPDLQKNRTFPREECNGIITTGSDAIILTLYKKNWPDSDELLDKHIEAIENYIRNVLFYDKSDLVIYHNNSFSKFGFSLVPECAEYEEILLAKYPFGRKFVPDNRVSINPAVDINLDTLITWEMCRDRQLLEKAIINSDYQSYPLTVAAFILAEKNGIRLHSSSAQMKRVLDFICVDELDYSRELSYKVRPEDYAMLQSWIMYKLGLPENGGWVDDNLYRSLHSVYVQFLKTRLACTKVTLNEAVSSSIIKQHIENSDSNL